MRKHDYSPEDAFSRLMIKLKNRNEILALEIHSIIDDGKEIPKESDYKNVSFGKEPYSYSEALHVALNVLEEHFIVQPLFVGSILENMSKTSLGDSKSESDQKRMTIEIEIQTETQLPKGDISTLILTPIPHDSIIKQQNNFKLLRDLTISDEE
jgi:hypothetical protein